MMQTINILSYLNSKDVAAYLKSIDYHFSPIECAFVIYQSRKVTMQQRHSAWREVINTLPDCTISERLNLQACTLHQLIEAEINNDNAQVDWFNRKDDSCYSFRIRFKGEHDWQENYNRAFADFDSCFTAIENDYLCYNNCEVAAILIKKQLLHNPEKSNILAFDTHKNIYKVVEPCYDFNVANSKEKPLSFDGLWLNIPTPFRYGDIVYCPDDDIYLKDEPFVLTDMANWGSKELAENGIDSKAINYQKADMAISHLTKDGDESDMIARGYFVDTQIYEDHTTFNYLDLAYYHDELKGNQRIYTALSNYLKGKIELELLLAASNYIFSENHVANLKDNKLKSWYTKEGLFLAGLNFDDNDEP
jgi:hypothetical protein